MSATQDQQGRGIRAAKNQSLFREINERVKDLNEAFSDVTEGGDWVCECANESCTERVEMSVEEYEEVRAGGARFFVAPSDDHLWPDVEHVTARMNHYWVVEKFGDGGRLAEEADPRSS
jgi:hypothetical protein